MARNATSRTTRNRQQNEKRARARAAVEQLLGGRCHRCGGRGPYHVWRSDRRDRGGITPWLVCTMAGYVSQIEGAELLCLDCHREKLREHAKETARLRKLLKTELGRLRWKLSVEAADLIT